ncbi:hypothetical protein COY48_01070 [Candidatus Collierbacteria bacterium CG_4_10_14_0_8_um_filter_43_86]|nr:MAG: hypothetical protein COY48_01070 [Candidatus Collierbacteria bacterium CG_4_10_14_0_8_um_filter_43_86]
MSQDLVRNVNKTSQFIKSCECVGKETIEFIENWAQTVLRQQVSRNKCYFVSPNCKFEIWVAGLPNIEANKGKSGGFRLVYFYVFHNDSQDLFLDFIEHRNQIGFGKERPKEKEKFEKYVRELKKELMTSLDM